MNGDKLYKTGFALSGGFIKGFAHLGAVQALYEADIRPDMISGVSAGSLAGVFLADGKEPYEIIELFESKDFGDFTKFSFRVKGGFMSLEQLDDFIYSNLSVRRLENLKLPTIVTATDIDSGMAVHFHEGDIGPRVAASCCMPGLFIPIVIDGKRFVDGGVFMNLPVSIIRNICEKVVAINVSTILEQEYKPNFWGIMMRTYHLMSHSNSQVDRRMADMLIEPENLDSYSNRELHKAGEIFETGYNAAQKVIEQVKDIVFPPSTTSLK